MHFICVLIRPLSSDEVPVKKLKDEPKDAEELKQEEKKEKKMEKQNKLYFKYRNMLKDLSKTDLHEILEENSQALPAGKDEVFYLRIFLLQVNVSGANQQLI